VNAEVAEFLSSPNGDPEALTHREIMVFRFIRDYSIEHGFAPTVREIGDAADLASTSSVYYVLNRLHMKGYINRKLGRRGGISVVPAHAHMVLVRRDDLVKVLMDAEGFVGSKDSKAFTRLAEAAGVS
jgi:SOS-response transcriptional repressor LexA